MTDAEEPSPPADEQSPGAPSRPDRWKLSLVIAGIVIIQIGNFVASASIFALIARHPLWLVLLQPTTKNLLLVATQIPLVTFFVVTVLRRQVPHPLWFLIGRWYGDAGIQWIKQRSPDIAALITVIEDKFPKYGPLICLIYPHPLVCAMAGASAMRFVPFLVYTFIGIIGYVWAARVFGDWLSPVTHAITNFGRDYIIPLTILTIAIAVFGFWQGQRKGTSKIESVHRIEEELDNEQRKSDD